MTVTAVLPGLLVGFGALLVLGLFGIWAAIR